jgi:coproporphyrinogen III oxidase
VKNYDDMTFEEWDKEIDKYCHEAEEVTGIFFDDVLINFMKDHKDAFIEAYKDIYPEEE